MNKGYLVIGAENSGTRLTTRLLINAGCNGTHEHEQPFDKGLPQNQGHIVWRRSVPHGMCVKEGDKFIHEQGAWINVQKLIESMKSAGYSVHVIVTSREWYSMALAQVHEMKYAPDAVERIRRAYKIIFKAILITEVPYTIINYESLISGRDLNRILFNLGLPKKLKEIPFEIYDGNEKYHVADRF